MLHSILKRLSVCHWGTYMGIQFMNCQLFQLFVCPPSTDMVTEGVFFNQMDRKQQISVL